MGLDTVELIMAIEEEFKIQIPDSDAAKLAVLGDLHIYLIEKLKRFGKNPDPDEVWERLSVVVVKQLGVRPDQVTRSAEIVKDLGAD